MTNITEGVRKRLEVHGLTEYIAPLKSRGYTSIYCLSLFQECEYDELIQNMKVKQKDRLAFKIFLRSIKNQHGQIDETETNERESKIEPNIEPKVEPKVENEIINLSDSASSFHSRSNNHNRNDSDNGYVVLSLIMSIRKIPACALYVVKQISCIAEYLCTTKMVQG